MSGAIENEKKLQNTILFATKLDGKYAGDELNATTSNHQLNWMFTVTILPQLCAVEIVYA